MREELIDLWDAPCDARCITTNGTLKTNGRGVMGRGCAFQATQRYPFLALTLGRALTAWGNVPCILLPDTRPMLVSFPVKRVWYEHADLDLIAQSTRELVRLADGAHWQQVVLPRPGCGNGSRSWEREVRPLIQPLLDDRFTVVTL